MKLLLNLLKTPGFCIGIGLLFLTIIIALFVPLFYEVDILSRVGGAYMSPSGDHLMGTDHLGGDMISKLVFGLRSSMYVGLLAGIIATVIGTLLGVYAGFKGGLIDDIITLATNLFVVIPQFVILILISSSLTEGRSLTVIAFIIGLTGWPWSARAVRAQSASLKSRDHISLAKVNGARTFRIVTIHILPYLFSYIFMVFILQTATGILSEASISMIGLGPYDTVSLGTIMQQAMNNEALSDGAWWAFIPAMMLVTIVVFALFVINHSMEGVFNPRLRK